MKNRETAEHSSSSSSSSGGPPRCHLSSLEQPRTFAQSSLPSAWWIEYEKIVLRKMCGFLSLFIPLWQTKFDQKYFFRELFFITNFLDTEKIYTRIRLSANPS